MVGITNVSVSASTAGICATFGTAIGAAGTGISTAVTAGTGAAIFSGSGLIGRHFNPGQHVAEFATNRFAFDLSAAGRHCQR